MVVATFYAMITCVDIITRRSIRVRYKTARFAFVMKIATIWISIFIIGLIINYSAFNCMEI